MGRRDFLNVSSAETVARKQIHPSFKGPRDLRTIGVEICFFEKDAGWAKNTDLEMLKCPVCIF